MAKLNIQHHYFSLQCHMILQKSFRYRDLLLNKHFSVFIIFILSVFSIVRQTVLSLRNPFRRQRHLNALYFKSGVYKEKSHSKNS